MESFLITNTKIVNEDNIINADLLIESGIIKDIIRDGVSDEIRKNVKTIDAEGNYLLPGIIDTHVHFRDPGLTHKADLYSETKAAVAGGVTSFFDMPNTIPNVINSDILEEKFRIASEKSLANYSFYIAATNSNFNHLAETGINDCAGVKLFLGSSTGNMIINNSEILDKIFSEIKLPLVAHCEDEGIINSNLISFKNKYPDNNIPFNAHPLIRDAQACFKSSAEAIKLAEKHNARLHILHVSTEDELALFNDVNLTNAKQITSETCVNYLFFDANDYEKYKGLIKCNPSIKESNHKTALLKALKTNLIDIISTDHAPHTIEEKNNTYLKSPSGIPSLQYSLQGMIELYIQGYISLENIVRKMCHNPAERFGITQRGFIRKGYFADLVIADTKKKYTITEENILYKCKWSPFIGKTFTSSVTHTFVNGNLVYDKGIIKDNIKGTRIQFNR